MCKNDDSPEISLIDSVACDNLMNMLEAIADCTLNQLTKNSLLQDIPIFSLLVKTANLTLSIRDQLFLKKTADFLYTLSKISHEDRQKFINKLNQKPKKKKEFGQNILLLLEQADCIQKPIIIANLVSAYIRGDLDYYQTMRLCSIVNKCFLPDLERLKLMNGQIQNNNEDDRFVCESLFNVGLLSFSGVDGGVITYDTSGGMEYTKNNQTKPCFSMVYSLA